MISAPTSTSATVIGAAKLPRSFGSACAVASADVSNSLIAPASRSLVRGSPSRRWCGPAAFLTIIRLCCLASARRNGGQQLRQVDTRRVRTHAIRSRIDAGLHAAIISGRTDRLVAADDLAGP